MIVIIKATTACNGTCLYCSTDSRLQGKSSMPKERLRSLFEAFRPWLLKDGSRCLDLIWHGGEPLMSGPDFFEAVTTEQDRVFKGDMGRVRNHLQSNLTLVTDEWIPVLKKLLPGADVGSSFEIVEGIRGLGSGEDLARKWLSSVRLLHDHGFSTGVLYVVHKRSLGLARTLYDLFHRLPGVTTARFNPLYRAGRGRRERAKPLLVTADDYGRFLLDLSEVWRENGMPDGVAPLSEWSRAWLGDPTSLCCDGLGDCQKTHLGIGPDGGVNGCGRAIESGVTGYGNIFRDGLTRILRHPLRSRLSKRASRLREGPCRGCAYWRICHGGCPVDGWIYYGDLLRETYFCASRKRVFAHFEEIFGPPSPDDGLLAAGRIFRRSLPRDRGTEELWDMDQVRLLDPDPDERIGPEELRGAVRMAGRSAPGSG
jgi:uncharacterized protein